MGACCEPSIGPSRDRARPIRSLPLLAMPTPAQPPAGREELGRCLKCGSGMQYALRCRRLGPDAWQLELRCPECGAQTRGSGSTAAVRRLDREQAAGRRALEDRLRAIERAAWEDEIVRFCAALDADAILPEDFARGA
jgi:hypothetical protein